MTLTLLLSLALPAHAALPDAAMTAMRRGDCAAVLAALAEPADVSAALARARCGDADALEPYVDADDPLSPYVRLALARVRITSHPSQVTALLKGVELPGAAGQEVRLLRSRALIAQDRSLDARDELRKLLNTDARPEALYWLAWGAETRDDAAAAIDAYQSLWARDVTSPFADLAAERLADLKVPVPDFSTDAGRELALQRARALVKAYRAPEAIPLYDGVAKETKPDSDAWRYELSMALFKAKDYPRAMKEMATLKPLEPGVTGGEDTLFHFALGTSRTGDYDAAAKHYARLIELYPGTKTADTASFKIGYLDYDAGNLEEAIPLLQAHLERFPASKHKDEALWFIGWSHYRLGQYAEAEAALDRLLKEHRNSGLAPQGLYWKARIQGQRGDTAGEQASLEALIDRYPSSGHAWFAAERIGQRFTGIGEVAPPPLPESFVKAHPDLAVAQALADAGQLDWARERLSELIGAARSGGEQTAIPFAHALIHVGAFQQAQALARKYCTPPWKPGGDPAALAACYPRPEQPVVSAAAAASGLDPLLPYAIMTAESALDPSVTSIAGARGLMQMMPELGGELHTILLPASTYDPDQLYVAGYNAWLGTTELGRLHQRFTGAGVSPSLPLVIAGYNGGADAVARWLEGYETPPDADWFAENISYTETRQYVRRVLGYLMTYRWVYGD
ncbi:MAG: tetratricopeptide repeat protein [Alphaproteobacteria bacterium]|nr:tetratricopeptide repeat protein [Alphaproteobacteria bacterium]